VAGWKLHTPQRTTHGLSAATILDAHSEAQLQRLFGAGDDLDETFQLEERMRRHGQTAMKKLRS
jgi:hypothetical protein